MEPRLTVVTLGVSDLARARRFYCDGLGWTAGKGSSDDVVFVQLNGIVLSLFPRQELAKDAHVTAGPSGFPNFSLAQNVRSKAEVDAVMAHAERAGATILKPAQDVFWGGYAGYFADPDGFAWEIAWNPFWPLDGEGRVSLG